MRPWLRYLIALVVALHGFVYLNAARGVLPVLQAWKGTSWLLGSALSAAALKRLSIALWAVGGVGTIAAAIAFAFAGPAAWRPLAIAASAVAIASFLVFWDGRAERLVDEGAIGAVLSLVILLAAIAFPHLGATNR